MEKMNYRVRRITEKIEAETTYFNTLEEAQEYAREMSLDIASMLKNIDFECDKLILTKFVEDFCEGLSDGEVDDEIKRIIASFPIEEVVTNFVKVMEIEELATSILILTVYIEKYNKGCWVDIGKSKYKPKKEMRGKNVRNTRAGDSVHMDG